MKWIIRITVFVLAVYGSYKVYDHYTDDFRIANITDELPFRKEYEVGSLSTGEEQQLRDVLKQKFRYLGKGGQTYAFASDDGQYVLKLFKFKHHRPRLLSYLLPPIGTFKEMKEKHLAKANWKYHAPFKGYVLAYAEHKPESGLLFVHLNRTSNQLGTISVQDKLGFQREVDLDGIAFAIQKRGETFENRLRRQLNNGDSEGAKETIRKMDALFALEYEKGLFDRDFCVMRNTGFVGDEAIRIDIGQLCPEAHQRTRDEHMGVVWERLSVFLQNEYPQYADELIAINEE